MTVAKKRTKSKKSKRFPVEHLEPRKLLSATYYVSPTGSDSNAGTSMSAPWQTVAKVDSTSFQPGDSILFQYGSQYRASLSPISSGTVGNPITFGAYGDSTLPNPQFIGSDILDPSSFTLVTGNTYSLSSATAIDWVYDNHQFTDESLDALTVANATNPTDPQTNINYVEATAETFYYDTDTTTLYVNLGGALTGHTITATTRQDAISNNDTAEQSNLIFDHLDATETAADNGGYGIRDQGGDNVEFLNCNATLTGKHAIGAIDDTGFVGENLLANGSAPDQGFGGASAFVSFSDATRTGDTYQWINCTYTNPGGDYEVFVTHGDTNAIASILLQNMVSDNGYGNGLYVQSTGPNERVTVTGGKITGGSSSFDTDNTVINGLTLDGGDAGLQLAGSNDVVQNCLFTGLAPNVNAGLVGGIFDSGTDNTIRFNTFSFTGGPAIDIHTATSNTNIYGNIFDCTQAILLYFVGTGGELTSNYNLYGSNTSNGTFDGGSGTTITFTQWQSMGYDANSVVDSAGFVDPASGNYQLTGTSPAIDLFVTTPDASVTAITTDFAGNPRPFGAGYDAGAYELQSAKIAITGTVSVADVTVPTPLPGVSVTAAFAVSLSAPQSTAVTVQYATIDGTAIAGTDYTQTNGTFTFAPGQVTGIIPVTVASTAASATFQLTLSAPSVGIAITTATATGTISNAGESQFTFTAKTPLPYKDTAGTKVTLKLSGVGTGTVLLTSVATDPAEILLTGTTRASSFKVISGPLGTDLGLIFVQGSIGSMAIAANVSNGISVTGTVTQITAKNVGGLLSFPSAADRPVLHFAAVDGSTLTSASPIATLSATNWTDGTISAPSIGALQIKGSFDPDINLTGGGIGLASAQIVSVPGGAWTVAGNIGAVTVSGDFDGSITAPTIRALQIRGNLSQAAIMLTGTGATSDLTVLTVTKSVINSTIDTSGNIGNITVGASSGSTFFAGVSSTVTGLPSSPADFAAADQITSFTVTAPKTFANGFSNSYVAASTIRKTKVQRVLTSNNGTPFGFATSSLGTFSDIEIGQKPFNWSSKLSPSLLTFAGDFKVSIV